MNRHAFARFQLRNRARTRVRPQRRARVLATTLALAASAVALPQSAPRPEQLVKWRQSAYQLIGWNSGRIKAALAGGYDASEVRVAAITLAAVANSGMPNLFPPQTAGVKGWRATTANTDVFVDAPTFRALSEEFARDASELARLTAGTDRDAVSKQFARIAQACKSCHDKYRQTD
jgi:cytochrome c556